MAEIPSNVPPADRSVGSPAPARTTSKLSLMIAFAAGAAASWIIMEASDAKPLDRPVPTAVAAPVR